MPFPTHFISWRIFDQNILNSIRNVQTALHSRHPAYSRHFLIPLSTCHITLGLMSLRSLNDIQLAKSSFNELACGILQSFLSNISSSPIEFAGVGNFNEKVIYASLDHESESFNILNTLHNIIQDHFCTPELLYTENRSFTPHLTIAKLSKMPRGKRKVYNSNVSNGTSQEQQQTLLNQSNEAGHSQTDHRTEYNASF